MYGKANKKQSRESWYFAFPLLAADFFLSSFFDISNKNKNIFFMNKYFYAYVFWKGKEKQKFKIM